MPVRISFKKKKKSVFRDFLDSPVVKNSPASARDTKDLLYSTENSAQCYVDAWMGESLEENGYVHMYDWVPLLSTWNYHNIVNQLYSSAK